MSVNLERLIIICSILTLAAIYGYGPMLSLDPQSFHHWRQSDCASLTLNYYQLDLPFWQPQIHGLVSDNGTSGHAAPSEIPLYYWSIAQLYKLIGPTPSLLRTFHTLIFLSGIYYFILAMRRVGGFLLWSLSVGLLLFSSPILVYYGNNFLSNSAAFGLALIALHKLVRYLEDDGKKQLVLFFIFSGLAGSFKLPGLFLLFAFSGSVLIWGKSFSAVSRKQLILAFGLILTPILAWVIYARNYNEQHQTTYFSTVSFPIWEYSWSEVKYIVEETLKQWWGSHFHPILSILFMICGVIVLYLRSPSVASYRKIFMLLSLGLMAFVVLQFYTFLSHDYYTINMFIWVAVVLILITKYLSQAYPKVLSQAGALAFCLLFLGFNVNYARQKINFRYQDYPNAIKHEKPELYEQNGPWLESLGCSAEDTVIYIADASHTPLYLLNRRGWTTHKMEMKDQNPLYFNRDAAQVSRSIENGARFMIVHGWRELYERQYLHPYLRHLAGRRGQLFVFELQKDSGWQLPEAQLKATYEYDRTRQNTSFASLQEQDSLMAPASQAGYYTDGSESYLMNERISELKAGELIEVEIWVKHDPRYKLIPVIASVEPGLAFKQARKRIQETENGWRRYQQQLEVTPDLSRQGVKIFLWNPEGAEAFLSPLQIKVYHPNPLREDQFRSSLK